MANKLRDLLAALSRLCSCTNAGNGPVDEAIYIYGILKSSFSSTGGVKKIGSLTYTYGDTNQGFLGGSYSGVQCTTMALTALILYKIHNGFSSEGINRILEEGNRLHTYLREKAQFSNNSDGRIAIEDFPRDYCRIGKVFGTEIAVKLRGQHQNIFTSKREGYEDFLTVREYLETWQALCVKRAGFLLTIGDYSYAVVIKKTGMALLFDSHGHLKYKGNRIKDKAGVLSFPSISKLVDFLIGMYGSATQVVIAPILIWFIEKPKTKGIPKTEYKPYLPTTCKVKQAPRSNERILNSYQRVEASAYVGMMGGDGDMVTEEKCDDMSAYVRLMGGGF